MSERRRGSSLLLAGAWLALALVGVALYALWSDSQLRFGELRARQLDTHQTAHQALREQDQRLQGLAAEQRRTQRMVDEFLEELRQRYTAYETLLQEKLEPFAVLPDARQYPIEKVAFLLQFAQYKQQYLYDSSGALAALRQVRHLLDSLDEVRYHPLIQQVVQAIATLDTDAPERARDAHRILTASWLVLGEKIEQLQADVARQDRPAAAAGGGGFWSRWLRPFGEHVRVTRGAPRAVDAISAYRHVLILHAVQTELYLARLALQTGRPDAYAAALEHARGLLAQPALRGEYPALRGDLETLLLQAPFAPAVNFEPILRTLEQVR